MPRDTVDVCLLLEGTYPYVSGGVSSWTHDLIRAHHDLAFGVVSLVADVIPAKRAFELPENVKIWQTVKVSALQAGNPRSSVAKDAALRVVPHLEEFLARGGVAEYSRILSSLASVRADAGAENLLNSPQAWQALTIMYERGFHDTSFLDYFWTWRALLTGLYAVTLAKLPRARVFHAISTGYAGLMAARASIETGRPSIITEHGIYTNERRIEIALADWLHDPGTISLGDEAEAGGLKQLWSNAFAAYSRTAYEAAFKITTLYRGNQDMQIRDGAALSKLAIIPNGIDYRRFASLTRNTSVRRPCVALIGRVVPIKDVKTYIRAVRILADNIPNIDALILGPEDEDPEYAHECRELVDHLGLKGRVTFTGRVKLDEYLPRIDINVLTSVSEAQPLVILEAGAAGVPSVSTDVGCCSELIEGVENENPALGPGGAVTPLANPTAIASALREFLMDPRRLSLAGAAMKRRVETYYNKTIIDRHYRSLYNEAMASERPRAVA